MEYCVYIPETGEVMCSGSCLPDDIALQVNSWPGCYVYPQAVNDETHYMVEGAPTPRPTLPGADRLTIVADALDEVTMALPAGTTVTFRGETAVSDGTPFAFTTDIPGTYVFEIEPPFPYIPRTLTIEATDAV